MSFFLLACTQAFVARHIFIRHGFTEAKSHCRSLCTHTEHGSAALASARQTARMPVCTDVSLWECTQLLLRYAASHVGTFVRLDCIMCSMHGSCFCIRLCRFANDIFLVSMHSAFYGEASWSLRSHRMNSSCWLVTWTSIQYLFASALCDGAWRREAIAASAFCGGAYLPKTNCSRICL